MTFMCYYCMGNLEYKCQYMYKEENLLKQMIMAKIADSYMRVKDFFCYTCNLKHS